MIIDVHTHLWPGRHTGDDLVAVMDRNGVDRSVVLPIEPSRDERVYAPTAWVVEECGRHADRLIPFCSLDPASPGATSSLARWVREEGCRGLKLHPPLQGFEPGGPAARDLIAAASELGVPVLVHTGPLFSTRGRIVPDDLVQLDGVATDHPDARLILAHCDPLGLGPTLAARHDHVYLDTAVVWPRMAALIPGAAESALRWIGATGRPGWSKVLLGSDVNPSVEERLTEALKSIGAQQVSVEWRAAMLGGNAARLLGLGG